MEARNTTLGLVDALLAAAGGDAARVGDQTAVMSAMGNLGDYICENDLSLMEGLDVVGLLAVAAIVLLHRSFLARVEELKLTCK